MADAFESQKQTGSSPAEQTLWEGSSSQWVNFPTYFALALIGAGIIALGAYLDRLWLVWLVLLPAAFWLGKWWMTKTTVYTLTNERLLVRRGILNRHQDNLELYRVRDYCMQQPLFLRMLGLGNLELLTSDTMTPNVSIKAIKDVEGIRERLRSAVEAARDRKRVRQMDVDAVDGTAGDAGSLHPHA